MKWNVEEAKAYLQKVIEKGEIPGASVAVVTKDQYECFHVGYSSLVPEKKLLEEGMLYDLASLSKVLVTTTLTLKCIEKGLFSLQTKVSDLLDGFPHKQITIKDILTHTSGIIADDKQYKQFFGKEEMKKFIFSKDLSFQPKEKVEYSDFGYVVLGFVLEELLGPIDKVAKEWIFDPLGMENTLYQPNKAGRQADCVPTEVTADRGLAHGVVHDGKAYRLEGLSGNAGVFSNTEDLSKFVQMILGDGKREGTRVLSRSTIKNLKKCYTGHLNLRRTLGWFVNDESVSMGDYYGEKCLFHTGFTGTSIYIDFERECGIVLLTNRIHPTRDNPNIAHIRNIVHNLLLRSYDDREEDRVCQ